MLNVRIDAELEERLSELSRNQSITKTEIVKEALQEYLNKQKPTESAYALGKDFFGGVSGGSPKGSKQYKKYLKDKLHGKYPD
jgi:predicted DNA-binding protein